MKNRTGTSLIPISCSQVEHCSDRHPFGLRLVLERGCQVDYYGHCKQEVFCWNKLATRRSIIYEPVYNDKDLNGVLVEQQPDTNSQNKCHFFGPQI